MPNLKGRHRKALVGASHLDHRIKNSPAPEQVRQRAIYEALGELGEVVYAIDCPDGLIKIGHTTNLRDRRRGHGVQFEDILAVMPGTFEDEQRIHDGLRDHVARGREYYHRHADVMDFVNGIRSRAGIPAA
jgi:hypothetical protein